MITWRDVPGGYDATLTMRGAAVAHLQARSATWRIEVLAGHFGGPAGSVGHAKRAALEALAELLPHALHEVDVALRST